MCLPPRGKYLTYQMEDILVSTIKMGSGKADPNMRNPFGVLVGDDGIWVSNTGSSTVVFYKNGCIRKSITVPTPTGMCWGECGIMYVASTTGTIYMIDKCGTSAVTVMIADRLSTDTTVGASSGVTGIAYRDKKLYVVVPSLWVVQVYDMSCSPPAEISVIVDDTLSTYNYRPLGVSFNGSSLYITYSDDTIQQGFGYINVYKCGKMKRFASRGRLARPYSVSCLDGTVYVSNGNGYILTYTDEGTYIETVNFFSDGLRSIASYMDNIAFVAATNSGAMGTLGVVNVNSR